MGIKLLKNKFKLPCYAGPPPSSPLLQHILLLCEYTDPLGESFPRRLTWTLNYWKTTLRSHVYKGFPFINLSTTPIFVYLTYLVARCKTFRLVPFTRGSPYKTTHITTVWAHNHYVPYWKTTFKAPCLPGPPPSSSSSSQHNQPLCEWTKPLCGSIPL